MKRISTLTLFQIVLLSLTNYVFSQTTGIAIQGIARDLNNSARSNTNLSLSFELYYNTENSTEETVTQRSAMISTDAFGVFSYVLDPGLANEPIFAQEELFLRISEGSSIISNEKLKISPYAYTAKNGVPTGSIMPYIGDQAPSGWLLCDGAEIPVNNGTAKLRDMVGSNTPNLQGMFLRGTGVSPVNNQSGPLLMNTQGDEVKEHSHGAGTLDLQIGIEDVDRSGSNESPVYRSGTNAELQIGGETATTGGSETRPVNYGVNYIIKL